MSYIWEQANRGHDLYEMAVIKQKALVEAVTGTGDGATVPDKEFEFGDNVDPEGIVKTLNQNLVNAKMIAKPEEGVKANGNKLVIPGKLYDKCKSAIQFYQEKGSLKKDPAEAEAKSAENLDKNREGAIEAIRKIAGDNKELRDELAYAVRLLSNGIWIDGTKPTDPAHQETVEKCKNLIATGNYQQIMPLIATIKGLSERGIVKIGGKNGGLYKTVNEKKQVADNVQMPSMFESEPDDSMWDDIIVNDFGIPLINLSHPVVNKVLKSENPDEDCPGELKTFKKAVYGDKRFTAVFGEGGISRVVLGKMANLLTLGIAGATLDAGKRADKILKELSEKGGRIAHRNLLLVKYDDIVDADPDNESLTIPVTAYNRSKKQCVGSFDAPAALLGQFYTAVDPIASTKIYIETYMNNEDAKASLSEKSLGESVNGDENALLEGPGVFGRISAAAAKIPGIGNRGATTPEKHEGGEVDSIREKFISKVKELGHPTYYVLKAKSANKEVDVISTSATAHAGTTGSKVHMVTMKIGDHKAAAFMTPKEIKEYFTV